LSLSPCRLLRLFAFASISFLLLFAICCVLTRGNVGLELVNCVASNNWAFLCAGTRKRKQVRHRLSLALALQTGEAAFCFLDTAYSSRLAVLCTNEHLTPNFIGNRGPIGLQQISRRTLTTTSYYIPPHHLLGTLLLRTQHLIRRDASEAARCTMNLRLDIIPCHFTRSDPHE
jgi:hypothetical protein